MNALLEIMDFIQPLVSEGKTQAIARRGLRGAFWERRMW